jgi:hypothetical protein
MMNRCVGGIPRGRDSEAWGDFVVEARDYLRLDPASDAAARIEAEPDYAAFWLTVAAGASP